MQSNTNEYDEKKDLSDMNISDSEESIPEIAIDCKRNSNNITDGS